MAEDGRALALIHTLRQQVAHGFAAIKVLQDERDSRVRTLELRRELSDKELGEKLRHLSEKLSKLDASLDSLEKSVVGIQAALAVEEKARVVKMESWKATVPLYTAIVTGVAGTILGILSLLKEMLSE